MTKQTKQKCGRCAGTGRTTWSVVDAGDGKWLAVPCPFDFTTGGREGPCPVCDGSGLNRHPTPSIGVLKG